MVSGVRAPDGRIRIVVDPDLTDAKLADFERFFAPLALEAFAQRHNLQVEKYRYAWPNWSFHFRIDDEGSRGHLQVRGLMTTESL